MSIVAVVAANARGEVARAGLTQVQIGGVLGISQVVVSRRLRGLTPVTVRELVLLARLVDVPLEQLLAGVMEESS